MPLRKPLFIVLQVLLWTGFCLMPILFLPHLRHGEVHPAFQTPGHFLLVFLVKNIKFILLFYIHYLILLPHYFNRGRYVDYGLWLAVLLGAVLLIPYVSGFLLPEHPLAGHHFHPHRPRHRHPHFGFSLDAGMHFFMAIIVTLLSFLLNTYRQWIEAQKGRSEMELAYLKTQINHHFLFNTLNSIYSLNLQGSEKAAPAIHSLSCIMRYVLDDSVRQRTALQHELDYIGHYIGLQRLRLNDRVALEYSTGGDTANLYIAPMLLMPFIENCFQHGVSTIAAGHILIAFDVKDGRLHLHTENDIVAHAPEGSRIAVQNVRRRLEHEYSGRYTLLQERMGERFFTDLTLQLA